MANWKALAYKNDFPVLDGLIFYAPFEESVNAAYSIGSGTGTLTTANIEGVYHLQTGFNPFVADSSGHVPANTFSFPGTADDPLWVEDGKYGSGLFYDAGGQEWISRADDPDFDVGFGDYTMIAWVKPDSGGVTSRLFHKNIGAQGYAHFIGSGNNARAGWLDGVTNFTHNSSLIVDIGEWNFLAFGWSGAGNTSRIYLNGSSETKISGTALGSLNNTAPAYFGGRGSTQSLTDGTLGQIFMVREYLNTSQLDFLMNHRWFGRTYFPGKFGLGYYALKGNSLRYTANTGNLEKEGTIEMSIYPTWDGNDGANHFLFDAETSGNVNRISIFKSSGNSLFMNIHDSSGGQLTTSVAVNGTNFAKNTWHHVVGTYDLDGNIALYLNNVCYDTPSGAGTGKILIKPTNMYYGRDATSQTNEALVIYDEVRNYRRVLTVDEVKQNYEATRPMSF